MKRQPKFAWIIALVALAGVGLFAYPAVSNYIFQRNASTATYELDKAAQDAGKEALEKALEEARAYNRSLEGNPVNDPFLKGSGMVIDDNYADLLDLNEGAMGHISVPEIGVKLTIFHGTADAILQKGIGHLEGSSLPVGGESTHCVLTGHTGLAHAKMFTDLIKLEKGDMFYLYIFGEVLAYKIDQILTVLPEDISNLSRVGGEDYCTLVTCTPYALNTHRLLVRGVHVPYNPEQEQALLDEASPSAQWFTQWNMLIGLGVGLGFGVALFIAYRAKRKKEKAKKTYWWENPEL